MAANQIFISRSFSIFISSNLKKINNLCQAAISDALSKLQRQEEQEGLEILMSTKQYKVYNCKITPLDRLQTYLIQTIFFFSFRKK